MSKSFDIVMAGLISGIVALTTTFLGVAGTVIGAVLGAILYQVISIFLKEPLENANVKKVEREIVYTLPLALIAVFLVIFIIALLHSYSIYYPDFLMLFQQLEETTNDNLVRFMGIGLIVMGIYPLLQQNSIKREYGIVIFVLGFILLFRGLLDINADLFYIYTEMFGFFDILLNIGILLVLIMVIIKILLGSISLYIHRNDGSFVDNSRNGKFIKDQVRNNLDNFSNRENNEYNKNNNRTDKKSIHSNIIKDKDSNDKKSIGNKTIKSNKTSTMSKNRKFFK